ncbi:MAG TPA: MFS transporter [Candidatus Lokiarchaeia archaeon]|nr:MFS transporter [Candidatus Lokiarchaeia archaeon]
MTSLRGESASTPRNYRFFPIYGLVVLRSLANTVIGLALPNYLIFDEHMDPAMVGIIYSIFTIAYIAGPIMARPITQKIGIRNALMLAAFLPVVTTGLMLIFFIPWVLIACRATEGLILGFFWPNAQMQVSLWQTNAPPGRGDVMFRQYGYSWNYGCLLGAIAGFIAVILSQMDFLGLIVGWLSIVAMVPLCLLTEHPSTSILFDGPHAFAIPYKGSDSQIIQNGGLTLEQNTASIDLEKFQAVSDDSKAKNYGTTALVVIPIAVAYFIQLLHGTLRSLYNFTYPLLLEQAGWASYWAYLTMFCQLILQGVGIFYSSRVGPRAKIQWFVVGGIACLGISTCIFLVPEMTLITVLNVALGFFNGLLFSLGNQVMLAHGKVTRSLKYATIYETFSAIGYGVTPLVAGFIADENILWNFEIVAGMLVIFLIGFFIATRSALPKLEEPISQPIAVQE